MARHVIPPRPRARRVAGRSVAVLALWLLVGSVLVLFAPEAAAHTPHDNIVDVAPSIDFAENDTVFAISRARLVTSTDGGDTWSRVVNGLDNRSVLSSLATSPADSDVMYVATRGSGVYRSGDHGATWTNVTGDLDRPSILVVEASPNDADVVVALGAGGQGVASLSLTGGTTWEVVPDIVEPTAVSFVDGDPDFIAIGDGAGTLHLSTDGGATWRTTDLDGRRNGAVQAISPSLDFENDSMLFVGTESGGVLRSDDGGSTFDGGAELDLRDSGLTDLMVMDVTASATPDGGMRLWASTRNDGAFVSDDEGATWSAALDGLTKDEMADRIGAPNFTSLEVAGGADGEAPVVFFGTFDGLFRTDGPDQPWSYLVTQVSTNIAGFDLSPDFSDDQTVAVATYINGLRMSTDAGDTFVDASDGLAFSFEWTRAPDYVARLTGVAFYPDFAESRKMFVGARGYYLESDDAGAVWNAHQPDGLLVRGESPPDYLIPAFSPNFAEDGTAFFGTDTGKVFRYEGDVETITRLDGVEGEIFTVVVSPDYANDQTVMLGTETGVVTSRDGGETFAAPDEGVGGDISAMVVSPAFADDQTAWAGTHIGLWVTRDGGETFSQVPDEAFGPAAIIEGLAVSPDYRNDGTLLVSVRGRGLFRSSDRGESFEPIAPELLEQQVVFESFYHPTGEPMLFSPDYATDRTVFGIADDHLYRSTDAGDTWTTLDVPVVLHDPAADPPRPLLTTARFGGPTLASEVTPGEDTFETPIGFLSAKRIAAAVLAGGLAFGVLLLPVPGREERRALLPSWKARALIGVGVVAGALLLLAV